MLTTSIKGRALDYSRVVGGRLFRGIVNATIGEKDNVYAVSYTHLTLPTNREV